MTHECAICGVVTTSPDAWVGETHDGPRFWLCASHMEQAVDVGVHFDDDGIHIGPPDNDDESPYTRESTMRALEEANMVMLAHAYADPLERMAATITLAWDTPDGHPAMENADVLHDTAIEAAKLVLAALNTDGVDTVTAVVRAAGAAGRALSERNEGVERGAMWQLTRDEMLVIADGLDLICDTGEKHPHYAVAFPLEQQMRALTELADQQEASRER